MERATIEAVREHERANAVKGPRTMADQFDREDVEAVADCLGDDAAQLRQENDEDERADNMDRAASMLTWMLLTHPAYASGVETVDGGQQR